MSTIKKLEMLTLRKTQIYNAADAYVVDAYGVDDLLINECTADDFAAGAEWADNHPYWHPYPEVPVPFTREILVIYGDGSYGITKHPFTVTDREKKIEWWMLPPQNPDNTLE